MIDCSKDIRKFHDQEVTLPQAERSKMRNRRDTNRNRLSSGLSKADKPVPIEFVVQGSYAMKTMTRDPDNDYDIDDGVYFDVGDLIGPRGAEMTALQARQMVRDAVDDGSFARAPEVRKNCVRVYYKAGYHVDLPVYRQVVTSNFLGEATHYELASSAGWKRSDAREVTSWYEEERKNSSDAQQLRRLNRILKKFARSRNSWREGILSGFGITVLLVECYCHDEREDIALYNTLVAIRNRLRFNLEVANPVTPDQYITSGIDDARARLFREKLADAINSLGPLLDYDCTREQALACWDKVFATTFFSDRLENELRASATGSSIITSAAFLSSTAHANNAISSAGGNRSA